VEGNIGTSYNSAREGALRWQGVILNAPAGTPVRAVYAGRVVFADWLRGYGLLTIVDHGNGYLTLYGYNQSLLREVGEWVAAGDSLALAGNSGGNRASGLYFEIRHRGKAVNPTRWCNRRVTLPPLAQNTND
jgi:septal ring factor EnvC (AmiA/AmiB activator)